MAKYRKILVAYDGSSSARNALTVAARMARESKSWIKVLAVAPPYEGDLELIGVRNIKETILGPGQKLLTEAQAIADHEDVHILKNLEQGEPYDRIVHVAEDENCDLIVMGRRGVTHVEREFIGSVTARVIGHTNRDVLVVPENAALEIDNILVAVDGSKYSKNAVDHAINLAAENKAELTALHVVYTNDEYFTIAHEAINTLVDEAKHMLADIVNNAGTQDVTVNTRVREGEPHEAILAEAAERKANPIVMGSHGRKGMARLLMGSVTERVIGFARCPVLIVHGQ